MLLLLLLCYSFVKEYLGSVTNVPSAQSQSDIQSQCDALNKLLAEKDVEIAALKKQVEQLKQQLGTNIVTAGNRNDTINNTNSNQSTTEEPKEATSTHITAAAATSIPTTAE